MYRTNLKKKIADRETVKGMIRELGNLLPMTHEQIIHRAIEKYYFHHINELRVPQVRKDIKNFLLKKQEFSCFYCHRIVSARDATIDHKNPLSREGTHDIENLCVACMLCNSTKGSMTEEEFRKIGSSLIVEQ